MKKSLIILFVLSIACGMTQAQDHEKATSYGEKISPDNAVEVKLIKQVLAESDSVHAKIVGTVSSVCKKKGCWMKMDIGDGESMMVRFYDYGFFLPKDCEGKKVILEGSVYYTVTSVEELQHYASDAGKSKEEIANITTEEKTLAFEATGVLLYNK